MVLWHHRQIAHHESLAHFATPVSYIQSWNLHYNWGLAEFQNTHRRVEAILPRYAKGSIKIICYASNGTLTLISLCLIIYHHATVLRLTYASPVLHSLSGVADKLSD